MTIEFASKLAALITAEDNEARQEAAEALTHKEAVNALVALTEYIKTPEDKREEVADRVFGTDKLGKLLSRGSE